jgi:hypothetical protein
MKLIWLERAESGNHTGMLRGGRVTLKEIDFSTRIMPFKLLLFDDQVHSPLPSVMAVVTESVSRVICVML